MDAQHELACGEHQAGRDVSELDGCSQPRTFSSNDVGVCTKSSMTQPPAVLVSRYGAGGPGSITTMSLPAT